MNTKNEKSQGKAVELVFHNIHDHGVEIVDMWMDEVTARSDGRVRFTKSNGEDPKAIETADLVRDVPAMGSRYPLLNLVQVPFNIPSATVGSKVIAQLYTEFSELRNELSDVKVVGLSIGALMAIFSSKKWGPIRTLEDFKGARTRSLTMIDPIIETLEGKPLHISWFDIPRLLETGEIDAAVLGVLPGHMFKLADGAAPYCTIAGKTSITMHPMRTYMKWHSWSTLPSDLQQIIEGIGPSGGDCWFALQSGLDADKHMHEALEYIKLKGELIELTQEELKRWRRLVQPHVDSAISEPEGHGLPARRFYERMIELIDKYS